MVLGGHRFEFTIEHLKSAEYIKGVLGTQPVRSVPAWMSYRAYRSVRYRFWCRTELTEVSGTGLDVVPNLVMRPIPVLTFYHTYRSVRYRYRC